MPDYTILPLNEPLIHKDQLAVQLASVPMDLDAICLVTDLFERYKERKIADQFRIQHFDCIKSNSIGLLLGITDLIVVFWSGSTGHFWFRLDQISFEHPAAFTPGSRAPIIDKPRLGECYRFTPSHFRTLAKITGSSDALRQYRQLLQIKVSDTAESSSDEGNISGRPALQPFKPLNAQELFGGQSV